MDECYGFEEERFWTLVAKVLEHYQQRFPELAARFSEFDLFVPSLQAEKLTLRKLHTDNTKYHMHEVPNPLYEARKRLHQMPVGGKDHVYDKPNRHFFLRI
ncbi:IucA/IucC family C-terminal-domain containing protein [Brevibacillus daliensis]|uniref:IucA/IucC family C-terminal-domain containing protein n=1 Tax=Brevibacillus daliensis TaxID=2892995 RepID=UPI002104BB40|nr:IucA/IucC family C-terminal-domain containing protein [Brevibacillus daliensis]